MIVCVGDLMLDVLVAAGTREDGMPGGIFVRGGGSAANTAVWARRAGVETAVVAAVGDDAVGDLLVNQLRREDVRPEVTHLRGMESGTVISRVGRRGNRTMHSARWAAAQLRSDYIPVYLLACARAVHVTGYTLTSPEGMTAARTAFLYGRRAGALLSLDPSAASVIRRIGAGTIRDLVREFNLDVVFPNRVEAEELAGRRGIRAAAVALAGDAGLVVVKDGARGCLLCQSGRVERIAASTVQPLDTTGAGDAFAGAWLAARVSGSDPLRACGAGNEAGRQAVTTLGARPASATTAPPPGPEQ